MGKLEATPCVYCQERGPLRLVAASLARCGACGFVLPRPAGHEGIQTLNAAHPLALPLGTVLRNRYRLTELIGCGAHGLTYLAQHEFLNHPCVVKVLPRRITDASDAAVRRLRAEASAGFRVNDPHVVRVLDCDAVDGLWFFVMEYVDGVNLAAAVEHGVRIDWRQAVQIASHAARGLQAIHAAGLLHGDVKPGNLILGVDGRGRVADLGVVRFGRQQAGEDPPAGVLAEWSGTVAYAAPEVLCGEMPVGPAADLYSLGASLLELVTGSLPGGGSVYGALLRSEQRPLRWPADAAQDSPRWFVDGVLRLLHPDPARRFESSAALIDYLENPGGRALARAPLAVERTEPRGVVVLLFENESADDADEWLGQALADRLAHALSLQTGLYIADREQFLRVLERAPGTDAGRSKRLLAAGRLLGAAAVVEGRFRRDGPSLACRLRVHTAGGDAPLESPSAYASLDRLPELEVELLARVCDALGLGPEIKPVPATSPSPIALEVQQRFFSGKRAFLRGDYETARARGLEALAGDPEYGEALGFVGVCCSRMGRYAEAAEYNRRQEELALRRGDVRLLIEAYANAGAMHYFRGEYEAAYERLSRAAGAAQQHGLALELAQVSNNLGFVLFQLGRQAEAEAAFLRAIETHKAHAALVSLIGPYNGLGNVLREQKRYDEARSYYLRALALALESDDQVNVGVAYMNLGHCSAQAGRLADAKHELAMALNTLEESSFWNGLARVYESMAEMNLRLGNYVEATRCADKRIELARLHANRRMEAAAWRQKSEALQRSGRADEARECLLHATQAEAVRQPAGDAVPRAAG